MRLAEDGPLVNTEISLFLGDLVERPAPRRGRDSVVYFGRAYPSRLVCLRGQVFLPTFESTSGLQAYILRAVSD